MNQTKANRSIELLSRDDIEAEYSLSRRWLELAALSGNGPPCTMFDMLNLPVDMIVTHSFTPINSNLMAGRIKRQKRQMQAHFSNIG
jgi:hypothetical protein